MGAECSEHRSHLELSYPMKNGIVQSWEDMRLIWDHAFYEQLKVGRGCGRRGGRRLVWWQGQARWCMCPWHAGGAMQQGGGS